MPVPPYRSAPLLDLKTCKEIEHVLATEGIASVQKIFETHANKIFKEGMGSGRIATLARLCKEFEEKTSTPETDISNWFRAELQDHYELDLAR